MVTRVKVSSRHQCAVPAAARSRLHVLAGDRLLAEIREGYMLLIPEPYPEAGGRQPVERVFGEGRPETRDPRLETR